MGEELTATLRVNVHWEEPRLFFAVTVYSPESVAKAAGISKVNEFLSCENLNLPVSSTSLPSLLHCTVKIDKI